MISAVVDIHHLRGSRSSSSQETSRASCVTTGRCTVPSWLAAPASRGRRCRRASPSSSLRAWWTRLGEGDAAGAERQPGRPGQLLGLHPGAGSVFGIAFSYREGYVGRAPRATEDGSSMTAPVLLRLRNDGS